MAKLSLSNNKVLLGVCGGIAEFLHIDAQIVRIAWIVAAIFAGIGLVAYLLVWLVLFLMNKK